MYAGPDSRPGGASFPRCGKIATYFYVHFVCLENVCMRLLFRSHMFAFLLLIGVAAAFPGASHAADAKEPAKEAPNKFDALKRFSQVLDLVERYYVRDVT